MGSIRRAPCPRCRKAKGKCRHPEAKRAPYEVRYRDPAGSQRTRTFAAKSDASAFVATVEADKLRGTYVDPAGARVLFAEWAAHAEATRVNRRPTTRSRDAALMRSRVLPAFGDCQLGAVDVIDVKAWIAALEAAGLAPSTVRKCYQLAARVFDEAVDASLIPVSPCRRISLPPDERPKASVLTGEEVERLAEVVPARFRALVLTAAYTGCRWGELAGLRVGRLDVLRRRFEVAEVLIEVDGGAVTFGPPKTAKSRGVVTFPAFLADELAAHVATYSTPDDPAALLFTSEHGAPLRRSNFRRRVWQPALREAGLPASVTFHALRHACASWLIDAGANPLEVAEKLRHARVTTTFQVYGHLMDGTASRVDELLDHTRERARNASSGGGDVVELPTSGNDPRRTGR